MRYACFLFFLLPILVLFRQASLTEITFFFLAATLHEVGHLLAAICFGSRMKAFSLSPTGAKIALDLTLLPYKKEALIYLSGPACNALGMLISFFLLRAHFTAPLLYFLFCNGLFFLLNLLPVSGLDGYQALRALLCLSGEEEVAEQLLLPWSRLCLILLLGAGSVLFLFCRNASLLLLSLSLILEGQTKKATKKS